MVCPANNCEVVVSPANTSHFLQPCDHKRIKIALNEFRNTMSQNTSLDTRKVGVNLACGVHGFESIATRDIQNAFATTGVYPLDEHFLLRFRPTVSVTSFLARKEQVRLEHANVSSRLPAVRQRHSDREITLRAAEIMNKNLGPSQTLQQLTLLIRNAETVNSILMACNSETPNNGNTGTSPKQVCRDILDVGAPAKCVTMGQALARRRKLKKFRKRRIRSRSRL